MQKKKLWLLAVIILVVVAACVFLMPACSLFKKKTNEPATTDEEAAANENASTTTDEEEEEEEPYYSRVIFDYEVEERESNNTIYSAQELYINGTTVHGSVNKSSDVDYYHIGNVLPGQEVTIILAPTMSIDADGMLCGLYNGTTSKVLSATVKTKLGDSTVKMLVYTNNTGTTIDAYAVNLYDSDYTYKNTVGYYYLYAYVK